MKKILLVLLMALLKVKFSSQVQCLGIDSNSNSNSLSEDYCRTLRVEVDYTHCCYVKYRDSNNNERKDCWQLTDDAYENIKRFKDYTKQQGTYSKLTIKCSANFISSSLFILFSLFGLLF